MIEAEEVLNILGLIVNLAEKYGVGIYDVFKQILNADKSPKYITAEDINNIFNNEVTPAYNALKEACSK